MITKERHVADVVTDIPKSADIFRKTVSTFVVEVMYPLMKPCLIIKGRFRNIVKSTQ